MSVGCGKKKKNNIAENFIFFTENYWYNPPSEWRGIDIAFCIILSIFIFPVVLIVVWSFVFSPAIHKFFLRPLLFKKNIQMIDITTSKI